MCNASDLDRLRLEIKLYLGYIDVSFRYSACFGFAYLPQMKHQICQKRTDTGPRGHHGSSKWVCKGAAPMTGNREDADLLKRGI